MQKFLMRGKTPIQDLGCVIEVQLYLIFHSFCGLLQIFLSITSNSNVGNSL